MMGRPKGSKNKPKVLTETAVVIVVPRKRGRPKKGEERTDKWHTKLTNKGYDPCPNCKFPEAYGGYCEECGWMEPLNFSDGTAYEPKKTRKRKQ